MNFFQKIYRNRQIKKLAYYNKKITYYSNKASHFEEKNEEFQKMLNAYQDRISRLDYLVSSERLKLTGASKSILREMQKKDRNISLYLAKVSYFETLKTELLKQMDM